MGVSGGFQKGRPSESRQFSSRPWLVRWPPRLRSARAPRTSLGAGAARVVGFEERVRAEQRIDAVYGATLIRPPPSSEASGPRAEAKVRAALKKSIVLEHQLEDTHHAGGPAARASTGSSAGPGMRDRLRQLYAALDNDALLIEEALARPVLADRLTADFFAYDGRIHADAKAFAVALRTRLETGVRVRLGQRDTNHRRAGPGRQRRHASAVRGRRQQPSGNVGAPGALEEDATAFTFDVAVELRPDLSRVERYLPFPRWRGKSGGTRRRWRSTRPPSSPKPPLRSWAKLPCGTRPRLPGSELRPGGQQVTTASWEACPDPRFGHTAIWTGTEMTSGAARTTPKRR